MHGMMLFICLYCGISPSFYNGSACVGSLRAIFRSLLDGDEHIPNLFRACFDSGSCDAIHICVLPRGARERTGETNGIGLKRSKQNKH